MNVTVTGGAGFIGSHVCETLLNNGHDVCVVFDHTYPGKVEHLIDRIHFLKGDIRRTRDCIEACRWGDSIIHLAALINVDHSIRSPKPFWETNVKGTMNMLHAAKTVGCKKFTFMSTFEIYGEVLEGKAEENKTFVDPRSPYGASKFAAERYVLSYGASYPRSKRPMISVIRGANTFGPRQSYDSRGAVIAIFIVRILTGHSPVIYGDGLQTRDYVYVKDMARGIVKVATTPNMVDNQVFNLCSGNEISIKEIAEKVIKYTNSDLPIKYAKARMGENRRSVGCGYKAFRLLNWKPVYSFDDGLKETINYFNETLKIG